MCTLQKHAIQNMSCFCKAQYNLKAEGWNVKYSSFILFKCFKMSILMDLTKFVTHK